MRYQLAFMWRTRSQLVGQMLGFIAAAAFGYWFCAAATVDTPDEKAAGRNLTIAAVVAIASTSLLLAVRVHTVGRMRQYLAAAEADLRSSKARFERALEGASCGLWEWNFADDEVWLSPRYKELLGFKDDELASSFSSWEAVIHPDDRRVAFDVLDHLVQHTNGYDVEYRLRTKSGDYRWFHARGLAISDADGRPYLLSGSIQDIHDRRQAEAELRQQEEYLRKKQKMEAIGQLAGGIAHEFNNLLQAISGCIQFAHKAAVHGSEQEHDLTMASSLVSQGAQLTRQLLDFSRCKPTGLSAVDPNQLIENLRDVLRTLLPDSIGVTIDVDPHVHQVAADAALLQQALINLCINARDAMQNRGTLTIRACNVTIANEGREPDPDADPGEYVTITVTDTGCGMTPAVQSRIFEPFYSTKDVGQGTGLGLSIVYGIVKEHRGTIQVNSQIGSGSSFCISIPTAGATDIPELSLTQTTGEQTDSSLVAHQNTVALV